MPKKRTAINTNIGNQVPTKNGTRSWAGTAMKATNAHPIPYIPATKTKLNISNKKSKNIAT